MHKLFVFAIALMPLFACAELYRDIAPFDTLADVKAKFPSAQSKKLIPAWAQTTDALYQFSGAGISGVIIVKFYDNRPEFRKQLESTRDEASKELLHKLAYLSDDDANSVNWVRWVPDTPFTVQRLVSKYGRPDKSAFSDENFQPYREWEKRGVAAYLSDDEKNVLRIDFSFTKEEYRRAYQAKYKAAPQVAK